MEKEVLIKVISITTPSISKIFELKRRVAEWAEIAFSGRQHSSLDMLIQDIKFWYSCITTLAIWVYIEKTVVFTVITNPNTSISKIVELIRPVDEWAEIAFSPRQNAEMTIVKHSSN